MIPAPHALLGQYASLSRRLQKLTGGTAKEKKARAAAIAALNTHHSALIDAHRRLADAAAAFETDASHSISAVNRSIAALRREAPALPFVADREADESQRCGVQYTSELAGRAGDDVGGIRNIPTSDPPPPSGSLTGPWEPRSGSKRHK